MERNENGAWRMEKDEKWHEKQNGMAVEDMTNKVRRALSKQLRSRQIAKATSR